MRFDLPQNFDILGLNPFVPSVHVFHRRESKTDVIEKLSRPKRIGRRGGPSSLGARLNLVDREIVMTARGQINVFGVGLPLQVHFKDVHVPVFGFLGINDLNGDMPEA
jgi:hypothetical protein